MKTASKCLYLDEVIDIKFLKQLNVESSYAIMCSNSETLKLYNTNSNDVELYSGHTDIILCIDTFAKDDYSLILTGAKDNSTRMWKFTQ